jgi:hypothetical protein
MYKGELREEVMSTDAAAYRPMPLMTKSISREEGRNEDDESLQTANVKFTPPVLTDSTKSQISNLKSRSEPTSTKLHFSFLNYIQM